MALLTDQSLASGVTLNDLIHIVIPTDTSQNPAGSSFKATIKQVADSITGSTVNLLGKYLPLSGGTVTGNTYFGITSGITLDQVNSRIGIGTSTPQNTLELYGSNSVVNYGLSTGGYFELSGNTGLPRFQATSGPSGSNPSYSIQMGVRNYNDVTFPGYGATGDTYVYASNDANGLNIINRQGTGLQDYIRFYAGQDANGTIPDIHIQGSGSTRGNVGIATITPTEKLDVNGNTLIRSGMTASTITISSTPASDSTNSNVLVRDVSTGVVKQRDITNALNKNYASFYDTGDQTGIAGTELTMSANTSDSWNTGITLSANTRFVIQNPGVYSLAFSGQMVKTGGNSATHAHIWLYQNGLDVPYSASQIGFPSNSVYVVAAWNFFFSTTTPNEYVELKWEINSNVDNQLSLKSQLAAGNVPAIPSLIVTINQVN